MHLKLDATVGLHESEIARDLAQDTADIVLLSTADAELALFEAALPQMPTGFPSVQLTNVLALGHPLSVDLYVERTLAQARLVILRLGGGESYWPYGVSSLRADALARGSRFLCLPGYPRWDPDLVARGTVDAEAAQGFFHYCAEGGPENTYLALLYAAHLLGRCERPDPPRPVPAAGYAQKPRMAGERPVAVVLFYRAHYQSGFMAPIEALCRELSRQGLEAIPIFVTSLKDARSANFLETALTAHPPDIVVNATAFAVGTADSPALSFDCPVLQVAVSEHSAKDWARSTRGLTPRDLTMHVVMPEVDGRIFANVIGFKERAQDAIGLPASPLPALDRVASAAELAAAWVALRKTPARDRKIAIVLANYPTRDGRLANGVGLDTPASLAHIIDALADAGYSVGNVPRTAEALMGLLSSGPTNELSGRRHRAGVRWPLAAYKASLAGLPNDVCDAVSRTWGSPERDPHVVERDFLLGVHRFGNVVIGLQPARGYNIDPKRTYHDPDLVPPHHYLAFYAWLRREFGAAAIVHLGKHGNLEWLPGKSAGLSASCFPEAILGRLPHLYPFIVNDPGEGIQAKRRTAAVIIDHLTPPLGRAELAGDLSRLELLIDEYALASDVDPKRAALLVDDIVTLARAMQLDRDLSLPNATPAHELLRQLDAHLCDLKELQIRDGLHIFGRPPAPPQLASLLVAIARLPRSNGAATDASLHRAIAEDLGLIGLDPLDRDFAAPYAGPRPPILKDQHESPWRTAGDTIERIETLATRLVSDEAAADPGWSHTRAVLEWIRTRLRPAIEASGKAEIAGLLRGLDGCFVPPGPSGAPTRGRPDVLPTGRNFFAVDFRAIPTEAAWRHGKAAAERLLEAYWQDEGEWPRAIALTAWGTSNMRTGGDDIAQALALIGVRPIWETGSGRVTGFAVTTLAELKRPRVDVTLRVSGLFRDAFPTQIDLFDAAVRTVAELHEPDDANPLAAAVRARRKTLQAAGIAADQAFREASYRIFGSKPGAYGAGLQALIDEGGWRTRNDLSDAFLAWSSYAYGAGAEGIGAGASLLSCLADVELVAQTQDNREHDILDSDDYYQFMGGLTSAVQAVRGNGPKVVHVDTSRPEAPVARRLEHEISRVVRGRAANPKWIEGVMRHGYKGAFEIAATVDYLFGFAASTDAVGNHHFDQLFAAYMEDDRVRGFMQDANSAALRETAARFYEAIRRGLWRPRSNHATKLLGELLNRSDTEESAA